MTSSASIGDVAKFLDPGDGRSVSLEGYLEISRHCVLKPLKTYIHDHRLQ